MLYPRPSGTKEIQKMLAQIKIFLREVITTVYLFFPPPHNPCHWAFTQAAVTAGKTCHSLSHKPSPSRFPLAQLQYCPTWSLSNTSHPNGVCAVAPSSGFTPWLLERLNKTHVRAVATGCCELKFTWSLFGANYPSGTVQTLSTAFHSSLNSPHGTKRTYIFFIYVFPDATDYAWYLHLHNTSGYEQGWTGRYIKYVSYRVTQVWWLHMEKWVNCLKS